MTKVLFIGHAEWNGECFDFKVGDWAGGIGLMMRRAGPAAVKETGGGIWPSIEKAKAIAEETVRHLLNPDCLVTWTPTAN